MNTLKEDPCLRSMTRGAWTRCRSTLVFRSMTRGVWTRYRRTLVFRSMTRGAWSRCRRTLVFRSMTRGVWTPCRRSAQSGSRLMAGRGIIRQLGPGHQYSILKTSPISVLFGLFTICSEPYQSYVLREINTYLIFIMKFGKENVDFWLSSYDKKDKSIIIMWKCSLSNLHLLFCFRFKFFE